ncbi:MAG: hypothetical protein GX589_00685, partial [Deltaproteobacteria bacterium]|nr:hypothetical protein [Deltaproteobacteria bacterium]
MATCSYDPKLQADVTYGLLQKSNNNLNQTASWPAADIASGIIELADLSKIVSFEARIQDQKIMCGNVPWENLINPPDSHLIAMGKDPAKWREQEGLPQDLIQNYLEMQRKFVTDPSLQQALVPSQEKNSPFTVIYLFERDPKDHNRLMVTGVMFDGSKSQLQDLLSSIARKNTTFNGSDQHALDRPLYFHSGSRIGADELVLAARFAGSRFSYDEAVSMVTSRQKTLQDELTKLFAEYLNTFKTQADWKQAIRDLSYCSKPFVTWTLARRGVSPDEAAKVFNALAAINPNGKNAVIEAWAVVAKVLLEKRKENGNTKSRTLPASPPSGRSVSPSHQRLPEEHQIVPHRFISEANLIATNLAYYLVPSTGSGSLAPLPTVLNEMKPKHDFVRRKPGTDDYSFADIEAKQWEEQRRKRLAEGYWDIEQKNIGIRKNLRKSYMTPEWTFYQPAPEKSAASKNKLLRSPDHPAQSAPLHPQIEATSFGNLSCTRFRPLEAFIGRVLETPTARRGLLEPSVRITNSFKIPAQQAGSTHPFEAEPAQLHKKPRQLETSNTPRGNQSLEQTHKVKTPVGLTLSPKVLQARAFNSPVSMASQISTSKLPNGQKEVGAPQESSMPSKSKTLKKQVTHTKKLSPLQVATLKRVLQVTASRQKRLLTNPSSAEPLLLKKFMDQTETSIPQLSKKQTEISKETSLQQALQVTASRQNRLLTNPSSAEHLLLKKFMDQTETSIPQLSKKQTEISKETSLQQALQVT